MARPKKGTSAHTRYRRANERLADFEDRLALLARSRPRTPGKKAAKTRALNALRRQITAARGELTKSLRAISQATSQRASAKLAARQKRSEAAKRGWSRRSGEAAPAVKSAGLAIPFLTLDGVTWIWPPSKSDRSKVGNFWNPGVDTVLASGSTTLVNRFEGDSVFDEISGRHLAFVTDPNIIIANSDEYDFGPSFYRDRRDVRRFAK